MSDEIRLQDGTVTTPQLLQSLWEMERRGYVFHWDDGYGLYLDLAAWRRSHPPSESGENPFEDEPGWEPRFVLDHIDQVAVLVQYEAAWPLSLQ